MPREMVLLMEQKKKKGKSVTTIEDTDLNRSVDRLSKFKDISKLKEDANFIKDIFKR